MLVISGWPWHVGSPVVPSDTVNQFGGTGATKKPVPVALVNLTGTVVLAHLVYAQKNATTSASEDRVLVLPVPASGMLLLSGRPTRVNATGTTNSGHSAQSYERVIVSQNGLAFTNQPANDGVEIVSSDAADTTQSATVYGTTQGTDTVVKETVALTGTTAVATVKVDWGVILGVSLSAVCAGTVTFREASGNATITTITTGNLVSGVETIATANSYPSTPLTVVASGATTKQIGVYGTAPDGTAQGDSQALTGATAVAMNLSMGSETLLLTGDLEANRTVTLSVSADLRALF